MTSHSKLFIGLFKGCEHSTLVGRLNTTQHSTACRDHCTVTTQHADYILIPVRTASVEFLNSTTTQVETVLLYRLNNLLLYWQHVWYRLGMIHSTVVIVLCVLLTL